MSEALDKLYGKDCVAQYRDDMKDLERETNRLMGWQPIESAPTDGTHILSYRKNGNSFMSIVCFDDGAWCSAKNKRRLSYSPTHWVQLPEPPK